jgi:cell division protease FtsH
LRQSHKTVLLWLLLILMFVAIYQMFSGPAKPGEEKIAFGTFMQEVVNNPAHIKKVTIKGEHWTGEYADGHKFRTVGPNQVTAEVLSKLDHAGKEGKQAVAYELEEKEENAWWTVVLGSWLPMLALVFIFFLFMRQLQAGGGKAMSFGKSKAKLLGEHQNKVTFADVAGVEEAKDEVEEIIAFLKDPKKFTKLGGRIPKGVLMMGPPGTGKTLLARAIAGEAGVPFFSISGSDFVEMFVGVGASRVRDLFEQGKKNAPCIIFIDEIDAVGRHRGAGLGGGHDEREQTLNQLLVEMDGFESNEGVILIAATNRPDVLDPALLRPGRFDRRIVVPRPDVKGREGILRVHVRRVPLGGDVLLDIIAKGTPGFSGADLESLVNEAALLAARKDKDKVDMRDFEEAKDKVLMGPERKSMVISEKEKRTTAYHEAGHALVAKLLPNSDPVHKVTIIPRGPALGVTQQLPAEDRLSYSKEWAENRIAICLGGRIAEELVFGQITTGAGNDIEKATDLAHKMVCEWGMSERMGPLTFGKKEEQVFLGRDFAHQQDYSEETARAIDAEVRRIVTEGYQTAHKVLSGHVDHLKNIAEALLEHETIDGEDIDKVLAGGKIERIAPPPPRAPVTEAKEKRPSIFARPPVLKDEPEKA